MSGVPEKMFMCFLTLFGHPVGSTTTVKSTIILFLTTLITPCFRYHVPGESTDHCEIDKIFEPSTEAHLFVHKLKVSLFLTHF